MASTLLAILEALEYPHELDLKDFAWVEDIPSATGLLERLDRTISLQRNDNGIQARAISEVSLHGKELSLHNKALAQGLIRIPSREDVPRIDEDLTLTPHDYRTPPALEKATRELKEEADILQLHARKRACRSNFIKHVKPSRPFMTGTANDRLCTIRNRLETGSEKCESLREANAELAATIRSRQDELQKVLDQLSVSSTEVLTAINSHPGFRLPPDSPMTSSDAQTIFPTAVASILDADDRQFKSFISESSLRAKSASRTTCCAADHEFCKDERDLDAFARLVADRRAERMTNEAGLTQEETHGLASILAKVATGVDTSAEDEGGLPPWCDVSALRSWTISATSAEMTTDELERLLAEEVAREDEMLEALKKERETRAIWETGRVKEEIRQATIEEEAELGRRERCVIDQLNDALQPKVAALATVHRSLAHHLRNVTHLQASLAVLSDFNDEFAQATRSLVGPSLETVQPTKPSQFTDSEERCKVLVECFQLQTPQQGSINRPILDREDLNASIKEVADRVARDEDNWQITVDRTKKVISDRTQATQLMSSHIHRHSPFHTIQAVPRSVADLSRQLDQRSRSLMNEMSKGGGIGGGLPLSEMVELTAKDIDGLRKVVEAMGGEEGS